MNDTLRSLSPRWGEFLQNPVWYVAIVAALAAHLEHVLTARKNQLALLDRLQNTVKQTELQLEHTLSVLGTIYSQIPIGQSTNNLADYGRLSANIDEEMRRLADQLEALGEVKGGYSCLSNWGN